MYGKKTEADRQTDIQTDRRTLHNMSIRRFNTLRALSHISLASVLWDIGKQNSPRCDDTKRGVPSGAILFADRIFIKK